MNKTPQPPKTLLRFFHWFCHPEYVEDIEGDLNERFQKRVNEKGIGYARWRFSSDVLKLCRPGIIKPAEGIYRLNQYGMFKHNLKISWRNLKRDKAYSVLNISGLVIGLTCSILILLWVQNEITYDRFHTNADLIYRVSCNSGDFKTAVGPPALGPAITNEMPEIKSMVRIQSNTFLFDVDNKRIEEKKVFHVDSNFLQMFSFALMEGNRKTALNSPNSILLTEATAMRYFGNVDVLGKTVKMYDGDSFVITGVLANVPSNSHLQFDFILPMSHRAKTMTRRPLNEEWEAFGFYTYIQLDQNTEFSSSNHFEIIDKMTEIWTLHVPEFNVDFNVQSIKDLHLHSDLQMDFPGGGNAQHVNVSMLIAIFILIVACINFMNLATARYSHRAKEVGLLKVIGARRKQLIFQFLSESLTISFISSLIAIGLVCLLLPYFNEITGKQLGINLLSGTQISFLLALTLITGLLSGSYPALFLSAFKPIHILQRKMTLTGGNRLVRNGLVVIQFVVSLLVLTSTVVVYNQLVFIKSKNLGFEKENLLYMQMKDETWSKQEATIAAIQQYPLINNYSLISHLPINLTSVNEGYKWEGKDQNVQILLTDLDVDENFIDVFQAEILNGQGFVKGAANHDKFIVNEKATDLIGMTVDNAVGQRFGSAGKGTIIGVVKNFNFKGLQHEIEPLILRARSDKKINNEGGYLVIRTPPGETSNAIDLLKKIHKELNPPSPFEVGFIDQDLNNLYENERKMGDMFSAFATLAILISCLGLYGLSAFTLEQRTKEIGIRKILGASVTDLVDMLSKKFIKLVLLAVVIATPVSWYFMDKWLQDFAYRIEISWWIFVTVGVCVVILTLFTTSHQVIKAALKNPVDSLRSE